MEDMNLSHEEEQILLLGAGLRCCDVYECPRPAVVIEADSDGARIFMCEDHREPVT